MYSPQRQSKVLLVLLVPLVARPRSQLQGQRATLIRNPWDRHLDLASPLSNFRMRPLKLNLPMSPRCDDPTACGFGVLLKQGSRIAVFCSRKMLRKLSIILTKVKGLVKEVVQLRRWQVRFNCVQRTLAFRAVQPLTLMRKNPNMSSTSTVRHRVWQSMTSSQD